jgi:lysophospholipase
MSASPKFPKLPANWTEKDMHALDGKISLRVYYNQTQLTSSDSSARMLYIVHGQAEQSDRYEHFPHYLQDLVDVVACVDLPGHGRSQGVRGHIENFDEYSHAVLTGFEAAYQWLLLQKSEIQAHWFGHSLGGEITLRTLLRNDNLPLKSVFVSAPLLELAMPVPKLKRAFAELIEPVFGSLKLGNELNAAMVSHDPSVVSEYTNNPLNHKYVTPRFFVNMLKDMEATRENRGPFHYNLMMLLPLADPIVSWKASIKFFQSLAMSLGKTKALTTLPGFYHESFNEIGKERAFVALADWLQKNS